MNSLLKAALRTAALVCLAVVGWAGGGSAQVPTVQDYVAGGSVRARPVEAAPASQNAPFHLTVHEYDPTSPVIISAGPGGRYLAGGDSIPVFVWLRAPATSHLDGQLEVSNGTTHWTRELSLDARRPVAELDIPSSNGMGTESAPYFIRVVDRSGTVVTNRQLSGGSTRVCWYITDRYDSLSKGLDLVDSWTGGPQPTETDGGWTVPVVHPLLAPSDPESWSGSRVVAVEPRAGSKLLPGPRAALFEWVREGGTLVTFASSWCADLAREPGAGHVVVWSSDLSPTRKPEDFMFAIYRMVQSSRQQVDAPVSPASPAEPRLSMPHWPLFAALGLGYAAVFGPLSLLFMRRTRRILHAWMVVPTLAIFATVGVFVIAGHATRGLLTFESISTLAVESGSPVGRGAAQVLVFAPSPGSVVLHDNYLGVETADGSPIDDVVDGDRHQIVIRDLPSFGEQHLSLAGPVWLGGDLAVNVNRDGSVRVANHTARNLPASEVSIQESWARVPPLSAHAEQSISPGDWRERKGADGAALTAGVAHSVQWTITNDPWNSITLGAPGVGKHTSTLVVTGELPPGFRGLHWTRDASGATVPVSTIFGEARK